MTNGLERRERVQPTRWEVTRAWAGQWLCLRRIGDWPRRDLVLELSGRVTDEMVGVTGREGLAIYGLVIRRMVLWWDGEHRGQTGLGCRLGGGGWREYTPVTSADVAFFAAAASGLLGSKLTSPGAKVFERLQAGETTVAGARLPGIRMSQCPYL